MNPSSPSEHDLVRGLRAGDHAAFAQVYSTYGPAVYNVCARILHDREEAKDVTQEVFLKAFSRPPAAAEDVKLRAWLLRVATNACLNLRRGRRADGGLVAVETLPAAGDAYEQAHAASLIERSLGQMNARYRAALVLKDLQGLDTSELAEVMEVSRPTADVLVHRSRAAFRKIYAAMAGEGAAAPASLAFVLVPLQLPASLVALPPLMGALPPLGVPTTSGSGTAGPTLPPAPPAEPAAAGGGASGSTLPPLAAGPDLTGAAGPAGAGLLAKLGAALTTKAAIVAAGATLVAGGGIALHQSREHHAGAPAAAEHAGAAHDSGLHHGEGTAHDSPATHHLLAAEHAAAHHGAAHHGATHLSAAHGAHHTSHAAHDATLLHAGSGSSATSAEHIDHSGASVNAASSTNEGGGTSHAADHNEADARGEQEGHGGSR